MRKQLVIIGLATLVVCMSLSGCHKVDDTVTIEKNKFMGTWKNTTQGVTTTITLFSNGTCKVMGGNGTWDLKDGKFLMTLAVNHKTTTYWYAFSNNNTTLSLTQQYGIPIIFKKQ